MSKRVAVVALGLGVVMGSARADDVGIRGAKLVIVERASIRRLALVARHDPGIHAEPPPAGPSITGATLRVVVRGDPSNAGAFDLPAGAGWTTDRASRARYRNRAAPTGGGVARSTLAPGRLLSVVARSLGDGPVLDIAAGDPGTIDVVYTVGPHRLCLTFDAGAWSALPGGGRFVAKGPTTSGLCPPPVATTSTITTFPTTTTIVGPPGSCAAVAQPPGSCAEDADCPAGYSCVGGACRGGPCRIRADCPADGECALTGPLSDGSCVCRGCGAQTCPLGCRQGPFVFGCRCNALADCPPEDDVCFMSVCS